MKKKRGYVARPGFGFWLNKWTASRLSYRLARPRIAEHEEEGRLGWGELQQQLLLAGQDQSITLVEDRAGDEYMALITFGGQLDDLWSTLLLSALRSRANSGRGTELLEHCVRGGFGGNLLLTSDEVPVNDDVGSQSGEGLVQRPGQAQAVL